MTGERHRMRTDVRADLDEAGRIGDPEAEIGILLDEKDADAAPGRGRIGRDMAHVAAALQAAVTRPAADAENAALLLGTVVGSARDKMRLRA